MKNKDEISTELKSLGAGTLSGLSAVNVFLVPDHYFGQFPGQMIDVIQHMNSDTSLNIPAEKSGPFAVPDQYFNTLADSILSRVKTMDEIVYEGKYSWQDQEKRNPFTVPEGYFEQFQSSVFNRIFHVEEDVHEEIEAISPLLASLKKEQTFTVPDHYFNSENLISRAKQQQQEAPAKVIQHPAVKSITWARWAAAAAVVAIFTLGGFHFLSGSSSVSEPPNFEKALAQIPDARIKDWLSSNMDEAEVNDLGGSIANITSITTTHSLSEFSEQEIKDYLETEVW
jgi:hypothetical protein